MRRTDTAATQARHSPHCSTIHISEQARRRTHLFLLFALSRPTARLPVFPFFALFALAVCFPLAALAIVVGRAGLCG